MSNQAVKPKAGISLENKSYSLRRPNVDPKQQLQKAAEMYEQHFLQEMVKHMRSSVQKSDLIKEGMGEKIYSQQLDSEYVKSWVGRGGIGLQKLIYDQMIEKFGPAMGMVPKMKGPMKIDGMQNFKLNKSDESNNKIQYHLQQKTNNTLPIKEQTSIHMPWDGKLISKQAISNDTKALLVNHPFGLQSLWLSSNEVKTPNVGDSFLAGEEFMKMNLGEPGLKFEIRKFGLDQNLV